VNEVPSLHTAISRECKELQTHLPNSLIRSEGSLGNIPDSLCQRLDRGEPGAGRSQYKFF
jgi:hypothetical protein